MRQIWQHVWQVAALSFAAFLLSGITAGAHGESTENLAAAHAVSALAADDIPALPTDFTSVMGYRPRLAVGPDGDAVLVKDGNGCSSPFGATSFGFSVACGVHDLGYDLLRYATAEGQPLGSWARRAIDARFDGDVHEQCDQQHSRARHVACDGVAQLYYDATAFNSWRQRYGNPGHEHLERWLAGTLVAASGLGAMGRIRRRLAARGR